VLIFDLRLEQLEPVENVDDNFPGFRVSGIGIDEQILYELVKTGLAEFHACGGAPAA
jgi:hypothetical protein